MNAKNGIWFGRRVLVTGGSFFKSTHLPKRATDFTLPGSIVRAARKRPDAQFPLVVEDQAVEDRVVEEHYP
jgi:hypothetical protein